MSYVLSIVGIIGSYFMIRYREVVGDMIGGRYQLAVGLAVFMFLWSLMTLTGTDEYLLLPFKFLFLGSDAQQQESDF